MSLCPSGTEESGEAGLWAASEGEAKGAHQAYAYEHLAQRNHAQLSPTGTQHAHPPDRNAFYGFFDGAMALYVAVFKILNKTSQLTIAVLKLNCELCCLPRY